MSHLFPSPRKGRIQVIIVAAISVFPVILATLSLWATIIGFGGVGGFYLIWGSILLASLIVAGWLLYKMLQKKRWARMGWVVLCSLWGLIFLIAGFFILSLGGDRVIPILVILVSIYGGSSLYLFRNYHVNAFFKNDHVGLEKKIEEMGKSE